MEESGGIPNEALKSELAASLSRRQFLRGAGVLGLGAAIASALPVAERLAHPAPAYGQSVTDGTLQAFFDTIIPGKAVPELRTELGDPIHPKAIAGVDREHGAVYTDALRLGRHPRIGFQTLEPGFLADLEARSLPQGGHFLGLDYERRERVCISGLAFSNPSRALWEAAAAVPFTAFCAAANIRNASGRRGARNRSAGYAVMGHPGVARHGYSNFSYRRPLARSRTKRGNLP